MNAHICLVSGEIMPNVIGAIYDHADTIVPVATEESQWLVEMLDKSLSAAGANVNFEEPFKVSPYDINDCLEVLRAASKRHPSPCFNWTGGTKVMSSAARYVAEETKTRAIYVLGNSKEILVEDFNNGSTHTDIAQPGLTILAHLYAAGHTVKDAHTVDEFNARYRPAPELEVAANAIFDANPAQRRDIFALASAENEPVHLRCLDQYFLHILQKAKLIQPARAPRTYFLNIETLMPNMFMESPQQSNARFLRASFLEVFLWSQIKNRSGYDEVGWGIQLNPGQPGKFMEIDVAVAGEGRLLILEAKMNVELSELTDLIEEQHARCHLIAGRFGRWIMYIHKFRDEFMRPGDKERIASAEMRAKNFGGVLVWHDDLEELPAIVHSILNGNELAL